MLITLLDKDKLLDSIFRVSTLITEEAHLSDVLSKILDELIYTIGFDRGVIRLFDASKRYLETQVVKNYAPEDEQRAFTVHLDINEHECLATKVARSGELIAVEKAATDPQITETDRMLTRLVDTGSIICAPLKIGEEVIGTIAAWRDEETVFYPEEISLFQAFASQMSIIIQNARLFKAEKEKIRELLLLQEAVSELNSYSTVDNPILDIVFRTAKEIASADRAMVYIWDMEKDRCLLNDGNQYTIVGKDACDERIGGSIIRQAIDTHTIVVSDPRSKKDDVTTTPIFSGFPFEIAIPIFIKDKFRGALYLAKEKGSYSSDQINILDILVKNAATAYDNAIMTSLLQREAESLKSEMERMKEREERLLGFHDILGRSRKMIDIFHIIADVAGHNTNILIQGESGTGKELIARAIHRHGSRSNKPFVDVNCAAIPPTLLESELFGYEAGAFTDARKRKIGLLEHAHGGTMLLDEIGEMSIQLQAKFLRMLEDGHIRRLGGTENIPVDVRFIFSTNRDLADMVARGTFREDLFYRIRVVPIVIPPLRERPDDIMLLARYFIDEFNQKFSKKIKGFDKDAEDALMGYHWPGNVRELKNIIERVMILKSSGRLITIDDLPAEITRGKRPPLEIHIPFLEQLPTEGLDYAAVTEKIVRDVKGRILENALLMAGGNKSKAAKRLGISRFKFIREQKKLQPSQH
ncbi:MAG: sigma 54-interacting transcriptional regulator [Syntrophales bacterium]|nr:sigma 54-interacting transcriptional regulator [Syntrophales bacterium]